jgi:hypothetical protein
MDFKGYPFQGKGHFPADDVDNRLADVAERSDVIVIDADFYRHCSLLAIVNMIDDKRKQGNKFSMRLIQT